MKCEICNNKGHHNKYSNMILCNKHSLQYKRHGSFLINTKYEHNDYKMSDCNKYYIINLYNKNGNKVGETLVDIEDLDKVIQYRIHMKKANRNDGEELYYATAKINGKNIKLHQLITGKKNIDHINNNGLDNRKENFRESTISNNGMNKRKQSNNTSGVVGIHLNKQSGSWIPQIKIDGEIIRLGSERLFDKAVEKRVIAEAKLFKEFSNNYNPKTNTIQLTYFSHDDKLETYIEVNMNGKIINYYKNKK